MCQLFVRAPVELDAFITVGSFLQELLFACLARATTGSGLRGDENAFLLSGVCLPS
jgi:hypothetical protein